MKERVIVLLNEKDEEKVSAHMVKTNTTVSEVQPLIKRIFIYLEDGEWDKANEYCERVLDSNPENSEAYIGKLLVEYKSHNLEDLANGVESFSESKNFQKVMRFSEKKQNRKSLLHLKPRQRIIRYILK